MERKKIHPDGPVFSRIISGAWRWHNATSEILDRLIQTSLDNGITTFDHADIYGDHRNEESFGNALRKNPSLRNKMELVTKCAVKFESPRRPGVWIHHYDTTKKHIIWAAENSLKMLGTDRIDVLLVHRPDPLMNPAEVAEAFAELKQQGKVLHFGVSNFTPFQFEMLQSFLFMPLVTNQVEISLSKTDFLFDGTLDVMLKHHTCPMAWSPLGGGKLIEEGNKKLFNKAGKYNATHTQLALAWLLKHPAGILPVIGTTKPERITESAKSIGIDLDRQDWFEMLEVATGKEVA